jgi:16S rRNA (guanine527-N7)-methyltransferase
MNNWIWFQEQAAALGVPVTDAQRDMFMRFHDLLVEGNTRTNLTRILDEKDAIIKHYLDALTYLKYVPEADQDKPLRFIDVGTGPGIPGIPLLIMRPHWHGVLLDSVGKKVAFMKEAVAALGLPGGEPVHGRAEELAQTPAYRETFDLGVARAVSAMPELLELVLPFVKPQGRAVLSKGSKGPEELASAKKALEVLKGALRQEDQFSLPDEAGERYVYVIEKAGATPKQYPRKPGEPHRKPIH